MTVVEIYSYAAVAVLALHAAFVVFVIGGQILIVHGWYGGWRWPRNMTFRIAHLGAVGFVIIETWLNFACPLTLLENWFRQRAGQAVYEDVGCISYWLQKLLFYSAPGWAFDVLYSVFAALVVLCFMFYPPRRNMGWKRRSNRAE